MSVPSCQRRLLDRLCFWRQRAPCEPQEIAAARALLKAVDAGGIPLNPARVNAIARGLGLEVSTQAAPEATIARLRQALARIDSTASVR